MPYFHGHRDATTFSHCERDRVQQGKSEPGERRFVYARERSARSVAVAGGPVGLRVVEVVEEGQRETAADPDRGLGDDEWQDEEIAAFVFVFGLLRRLFGRRGDDEDEQCRR